MVAEVLGVYLAKRIVLSNLLTVGESFCEGKWWFGSECEGTSIFAGN